MDLVPLLGQALSVADPRLINSIPAHVETALKAYDRGILANLPAIQVDDAAGIVQALVDVALRTGRPECFYPPSLAMFLTEADALLGKPSTIPGGYLNGPINE